MDLAHITFKAALGRYRIVNLYWLAMHNVSGFHISHELNDSFDMDAWKYAFGYDMPAALQDDDSPDALANWLTQMTLRGFLAEVEVASPYVENGIIKFNYDEPILRWFYGETPEELVEKIEVYAAYAAQVTGVSREATHVA